MFCCHGSSTTWATCTRIPVSKMVALLCRDKKPMLLNESNSEHFLLPPNRCTTWATHTRTRCQRWWRCWRSTLGGARNGSTSRCRPPAMCSPPSPIFPPPGRCVPECTDSCAAAHMPDALLWISVAAKWCVGSHLSSCKLSLLPDNLTNLTFPVSPLQELGYAPQMLLDQGLQRFCDWLLRCCLRGCCTSQAGRAICIYLCSCLHRFLCGFR